MTDIEAPRLPRSDGGLVQRWLWVLATTNPPEGEMDPVSRWLFLTRAGVIPMTLVSAISAGLLAVFRGDSVAWGWFALSAFGLVLAHMANNLMNDLFDLQVGTDQEDYPRNLYSPHPVLSGVISKKGLIITALVVNTMGLVVMLVLTAARGWPIAVFALAGFVLSVGYTAPPLRLKKHGLGEATVIVVWGPLMMGGTYYAATGSIPWQIYLASLPYAILSTTVLMGKHIDKLPWDERDGTRTLPVMLGEARARTVTKGMFVAFYALVGGLVVARILPVAALLVAVSFQQLPRVWKAYSEPKPDVSPVPNPVWPLWFAPISFLLTRRAGGLLILGLAVGAIVGW